MRIAVLGCGSIGRRHLRNLLAEGSHELLPYDPQGDARVFVEKILKLPAYDDLDQVWSKRPEAALIASTPDTHCELALEVARHGVHCFVEKPLATEMERMPELQEICRKKELITMVGCNMRFHPGPEKVKELVEAKTVGKVIAARIQTGSYLPDWHPNTDFRKNYSARPEKGGGAVLDCIHEIDLALWFLGPATVAGAAVLPARNFGIPVEGLAEALLVHQHGVLSSVHLNFVQRDYRRCCQIIGEHGTIYWDFEHPWVEVKSGAGVETRHELPSEWQINQMYVDEIRHFLHCVEKHEPTLCPLEQGIEVLKIALQVREFRVGAWESLGGPHPTAGH
jgi:predicted dehydrogenase